MIAIKKYIFCFVTESKSLELTSIFRSFFFNPFVPNAPFFYPLKTSENYTVFWCLQGGRERVHWKKNVLRNSQHNIYNNQLC